VIHDYGEPHGLTGKLEGVRKPAYAVERGRSLFLRSGHPGVPTFGVLINLVGSLLALPLGILDWRVPLLSLNSFLSIGLPAAIGGFYTGKQKGAALSP